MLRKISLQKKLIARCLRNLLVSALIFTVLFLQLPMALAHGGKDHGDEKAQAPIAVSGQMNVKVGKTSNLEVMVKYATPKFAEETALRIFITDLKNNAAVAGLKVIMKFNYLGKTQTDGNPANNLPPANIQPFEVFATASETPGVYDAHITLPDIGQYNVAVQLMGTNADAQILIGSIVVPEKSQSEGTAKNIRPLPFAIILVLLILTIAVLGFLFWSRSRRLQEVEASSSEHVA